MSDFYNERKVKHTRKEHRCFGCGKSFPAGRSMYYVSGRFEGEFFADHLCYACKKEVSSGDYRDGYCEGDLLTGRIERVRDWQHDRTKGA